MEHQTEHLDMKTMFVSHEKYLYHLFFFRDTKKTHIDRSILRFLMLSGKKTAHKQSNAASAKNLFSRVDVIDRTWLDECFLFHLITEIRFSSAAMLLLSFKHVF